jgi:hypothetical protein
MKTQGLLITPDGACTRVEPDGVAVFGMRTRYKDKVEERVPNHSSLAHNPLQHDDPTTEHHCIEAWTRTVTETKPEPNPVAAALVARLPCFTPLAPNYCVGPVLFLGWGGHGLSEQVLDVLERMTK